MHSEGIQAGELKHGTLAMVDENMPMGMVIMRDGVYKKSMNALQQVWSQYISVIQQVLNACSIQEQLLISDLVKH